MLWRPQNCPRAYRLSSSGGCRRLTQTNTFALIEKNRDHLTKYGDYEELYPAALHSVATELGRSNEKHRFGIWFGDVLIGRVDLFLATPGNIVLGYWLDEDHTGLGYATAAAAAAIDFGRMELGSTNIWAGVTKGNTRSDNVLKRLGFVPVSDMGRHTRFHRGTV